MTAPIRVTIWNEYIHEKSNDEVARLYPHGIHVTLGDALSELLGDAVKVRFATLDEPEHGLSEDVIVNTDVLLWWGHAAHDRVADAVVDRVQKRVLEGMGLIALHSAHASKIFQRLMGTGCMLRWREAAELERVWVVDPSHPIAAGIGSDAGSGIGSGMGGEYFEIPETEMYGEFFDIPQPDELVFISWFEGGEVFRSGCTFRRGKGKVFYFRPGHETYPVYHHATVRRVIANAVQWAVPAGGHYRGNAINVPEKMSG